MADQQQRSNKGNPAHKRMANQNLKNRRAASWTRGEKKKKARREEQKNREKTNNELRRMGLPTAWQEEKQAYLQRRHAGHGCEIVNCSVLQKK